MLAELLQKAVLDINKSFLDTIETTLYEAKLIVPGRASTQSGYFVVPGRYRSNGHSIEILKLLSNIRYSQPVSGLSDVSIDGITAHEHPLLTWFSIDNNRFFLCKPYQASKGGTTCLLITPSFGFQLL